MGRQRSHPIDVIHDTQDGPVRVLVKKSKRCWLSLHWGASLAGRYPLKTRIEANAHAVRIFRQLFPEHRCTRLCGPSVQSPLLSGMNNNWNTAQQD